MLTRLQSGHAKLSFILSSEIEVCAVAPLEVKVDLPWLIHMVALGDVWVIHTMTLGDSCHNHQCHNDLSYEL